MHKSIITALTLFSSICCNAQTAYFNFTGADQTYVVPAGVNTISVKLWGAGGGGGDNNNTGPGGGGAYVSGLLCVTPGETITIVTGGRGRQGGGNASVTTYGGGGLGRDYSRDGGSGGGRSAIIRGGTQVAIAGGGGGGGGSGSNSGNGTRYHGGAAGGVGADGVRGGDRDNFSGGAGGCGGLNTGGIQNCNGGGNAVGSQGGNGESGSFTYGGGGGGGGYAGGEGGASGGNNSGGGGGGSSYFSGSNLVTASGNARIAGNAADADNGNAYGGGGDRGFDNAQDGRVVISIVPGLPAITGTFAACTNATTQLSNAVPGGTWSSDNTSVANVNGSGLVSGVSGGTATISYSLTTACGTSTVSQLVTINALPTVPAISGGEPVCIGNTLQLSNSAPGGTWSSADTDVASVDNSGLVNTLQVSSVNITYTLTNGCGSASASELITISTIPVLSTIGGSTNVCTAGTIQLSNTYSGGIWNSSENNLATINNSGLVSGVASGQVTITYSATNFCGTDTETLLIDVYEAPNLTAITGDSTVCVGNTLQLSNSTPGGVWSAVDPDVALPDNNGLVTGLLASSVNIVYTVTNPCGTDNISKLIIVGDVPAVPQITGASSACSGTSLQLSNATSSGTWSSSNNNLATVDNSGAVATLSAGSVDVLYTLTNSCGSSSDTQSINIFNQPVIDSVIVSNVLCGTTGSGAITVYANGANFNYSIDNGQSFQLSNSFTSLTTGQYDIVVEANGCSATSSASVTSTAGITASTTPTNTTCGNNNGTVTATVSGGSASSYLWSNNETTASIDSLSAGTYTVTVQDANGCSATASATVNSSSVNTPTLTATNTQICSGDSTEICASSGFSNYMWNNGATSACIYAKLAGNYRVTATDANGCTAVSQNTAISVFTQPSVSVSVSGNVLSAFNASIYQWYLNGNPIPGANSSNYTATSTGSYSVVVTDANGCTATSNAVQVIVSGVSEIEYFDITVYPNPSAGGGWHISVPERWLGASLTLSNAEGRMVSASTIQSTTFVMQSGLPSGVYLLQITKEDNKAVIKLSNW